ncbi:MAG: translation initiation factor IF-2 subunit gamma, partial [Candidatus Aenigmatarchaeota archaeon]
FERVVRYAGLQNLPPIKIGEKLLLHYENQRSIGIVKEIKKETIKCSLNTPFIMNKKERKLAISRQVSGRWKLTGYGIL